MNRSSLTAIVAACLALGACATRYGPESLGSGATVAEVERTLGRPTGRYPGTVGRARRICTRAIRPAHLHARLRCRRQAQALGAGVDRKPLRPAARRHVARRSRWRRWDIRRRSGSWRGSVGPCGRIGTRRRSAAGSRCPWIKAGGWSTRATGRIRCARGSPPRRHDRTAARAAVSFVIRACVCGLRGLPATSAPGARSCPCRAGR